MKVIKMADKSQYSWATVQEYLSDELVSDSDDERRIIRSENRAAKKIKETRMKRNLKSRQPGYHFSPSSRFRNSTQTNYQPIRDDSFWRQAGIPGQSVSRQIGPCFKLSIFNYIYTWWFVFVFFTSVLCPDSIYSIAWSLEPAIFSDMIYCYALIQRRIQIISVTMFRR